jgi:hypothetical protein
MPDSSCLRGWLISELWMHEPHDRARFVGVGRRSAVLVAVGSTSCVLLAPLLSACSDPNAPDPSSAAFTGPLTNDLIVTAKTDCTGARIEAGDTVRLSGSDYAPDSLVVLRWTDENTQQTGVWPSVSTNQNGDFTASVKIGRNMAAPGESLLINSEGSSPSGLLVLKAELDVVSC